MVPCAEGLTTNADTMPLHRRSNLTSSERHSPLIRCRRVRPTDAVAAGLPPDMPTPFSGPPSPMAESTGATTSLASAPPSTLRSSAAPSESQEPRRPGSIFDELSAPSLASLHEEGSMHTYGAAHASTGPPCRPAWQEAPLTAPRSSMKLKVRQSADIAPQAAAVTAPQRAAPAAAVTARCLVPPQPLVAHGTVSAPYPQPQQAGPRDGPLELPGVAMPALGTGSGLVAEEECSVPDMQDVFDRVSLLGAMSSSSVLSASDRALSARAVPFPLMKSQQVQSSELPASFVLPRKLAKAAAVSAPAAAAAAAVATDSFDLGDVPPAATAADSATPVDTTAAGAPGVSTGKPMHVGAHFGAGLLMPSAPGGASGSFYAHKSPVGAGDRTGSVLHALRGAAAVPPRTPLATGAARMLAKRSTARDRSGASPAPQDTSRDVSLAAAVRPTGTGARRSLPFSDEDLANDSVLSAETSSEDPAATATAPAAPPRSAHISHSRGGPACGAEEVTQLGDDSQHSMHSISSTTCNALAAAAENGGTAGAPAVGDSALSASGIESTACMGVAQHECSAQSDDPDESTRPYTHAVEDFVATNPDTRPDADAVQHGNAEGAGAGGSAGGDAAAATGAVVADASNEEGAGGAGNCEEGESEGLEGRLHELDGDLQRMMRRLRMSWDGAVGGSRVAGGADLMVPSHSSCPASSTRIGFVAPEDPTGSAAEDDAMYASYGEGGIVVPGVHRSDAVAGIHLPLRQCARYATGAARAGAWHNSGSPCTAMHGRGAPAWLSCMRPRAVLVPSCLLVHISVAIAVITHHLHLHAMFGGSVVIRRVCGHAGGVSTSPGTDVDVSRTPRPDGPPDTATDVAHEATQSPLGEPAALDAGLAVQPASDGIVTSNGVPLQQGSPVREPAPLERPHVHSAADGYGQRADADANLVVRAVHTAVADAGVREGHSCGSDGEVGGAGAAGMGGSFRPAAAAASPSVKGAWETQCSGLSARRRR